MKGSSLFRLTFRRPLVTFAALFVLVAWLVAEVQPREAGLAASHREASDESAPTDPRGASPNASGARRYDAHRDVESTAAGRPARSLPAETDLAGVMRTAHFAFRPDGRALVGGHSTYEVRAIAGDVTLRPYRYEGREPGRRSPSRTAAADSPHSVHRELIEGGEFTLHTRVFGRDASSSIDRRVESRVGAAGQLEIERGDVVETWINGDDGTEQSWHLTDKPEGEGDLVVEITTRGLRYVGASDAGLHFADETGFGFRYANATWVDARGARTEVPATYDRGRIRLRVPAPIVDASTYPVVLDPAVGPEFGIDVPVPTAAYEQQYLPSVAFDGTNYLVVWEDSRSFNGSNIFGVRVAMSGVLLDPFGFVLDGAAGAAPAVAFDGLNFLVVWMGVGSTGTTDVRGTLVSPNGAVIDSAGFAIASSFSRKSSPCVTFDGSNYAVAWTDNRGGDYDVYLARVSTNGVVADPSGILVDGAVHDQTAPALAFDGSNYLVVWQDMRGGTYADIYGARVSSAGTVLDPSGFVVSGATNEQQAPAVAFDGTDFLVVWQDRRNVSDDIYGARVAPDGTVLDPSGFVVSAASNYQESPALVFDGTEYFAVWSDDSVAGISGAHVTTAGAVIETAGIPLGAGGPVAVPALAFDGANYLVVWEGDAQTATSDIVGTRVTSSGTVLDSPSIVVSTGPNPERLPSAAFDGTNYFVVWEDERRGWWNTEIFGARISAAGVVLDPTGIAVSGPGSSSAPAVDFDGTNFLVVWEAWHDGTLIDIQGARVSGAGTVLDPTGFVISAADNHQTGPALASDGVNHFVVWLDARSSAAGIYGARVTSAGAVLDATGIPIDAGGTNNRQYPAIAFGGNEYLVAWGIWELGTDNDVHGARITPAGVVLDAPAAILVSASAGAQWSPALDFDGTNFLVVWTDDRNYGGDVYGARVTTAGSVLDPSGFPIGSVVSSQGGPTIAFDGTNHVVAWPDDRTGISTDLFGARVSTSGTSLDPAGFPLATEDDRDESDPVIVSDGLGGGIVAYEFTKPHFGGVTRVAARMLFCASSDPTCDGLDDDCDGPVDEDYVPVSTACGIGPCASTGATSCVGGRVVDSCSPAAIAPNDTTCDGFDDDCDGTFDEDYVSLLTHCGVGACAAVGATTCVGGAVVDSCSPGTGAADDATCDWIDDDCDGAVDEDGNCGNYDASVADAGFDAAITLADASTPSGATFDASTGTDASAASDANRGIDAALRGTLAGGGCSCGVARTSSTSAPFGSLPAFVGLAAVWRTRRARSMRATRR